MKAMKASPLSGWLMFFGVLCLAGSALWLGFGFLPRLLFSQSDYAAGAGMIVGGVYIPPEQLSKIPAVDWISVGIGFGALANAVVLLSLRAILLGVSDLVGRVALPTEVEAPVTPKAQIRRPDDVLSVFDFDLKAFVWERNGVRYRTIQEAMSAPAASTTAPGALSIDAQDRR